MATTSIAGVAIAITLGGPGAVFWMWLIAIFGIATKYAEAVLAVHFREVDLIPMAARHPRTFAYTTHTPAQHPPRATHA